MTRVSRESFREITTLETAYTISWLLPQPKKCTRVSDLTSDAEAVITTSASSPQQKEGAMSAVPIEIGQCIRPGSETYYVWVYISTEGELDFVQIGTKNNLTVATNPLNKTTCELLHPGFWAVICNRLAELELEIDNGI